MDSLSATPPEASLSATPPDVSAAVRNSASAFIAASTRLVAVICHAHHAIRQSLRQPLV